MQLRCLFLIEPAITEPPKRYRATVRMKKFEYSEIWWWRQSPSNPSQHPDSLLTSKNRDFCQVKALLSIFDEVSSSLYKRLQTNSLLDQAGNFADQAANWQGHAGKPFDHDLNSHDRYSRTSNPFSPTAQSNGVRGERQKCTTRALIK